MSESSSFSSLLALVDSHLSKVNVQGSHSEDAHNIEDKDNKQNKVLSTQSDTGFPYGASRKLAIPSFSLSGNPVKNVLAEQVANMLKAKQQREEEQQKLSEEMKAINISDNHDAEHNVIDLMEALRTPFKMAEKSDSCHSSTESLFEPTFIECDEESVCNKLTLLPVLLPCHTDLSYILNLKVPQAKCSSFGKILVSKFRPITLPYKRQISHNPIKTFDFKSKSPCDILLEKIGRKCS